MLTKILKITSIMLLVLLSALVTIPYFFKNQLKAKITAAINEKVDAKVSFEDASLSLFKNFPNANVNLEKLVIINKAPFEGDTLVSLGEIDLKMSIKELFKGKDESINIEGIATKNGLINVIINEQGVGNFDIALKDNTVEDKSKSKPLALKIQKYSIENYQIRYTDQKSKMKMVIKELNHEGTGDFAASVLDLDTKTTAKISFDMGKVNYINNISLTLNAVLGIDMEKSKYTFKNNKAKINELPLEFNGFIQMVPDGQNYDLTFKTPTSSFQNFLGLIPAVYSGSVKNVKTTGEFTVVGFARGLLGKTTIPKFNIAIASNNASFQYPNLPKAIQKIVIDTKIINETGLMNDTYVNLDKLSFQIDQDVFDAKANVKNISTNALVDAAMKGTVNLANLSKAYPIKLAKPLTGILKADVTTNFDMKSVETSQYQNIKNAGNMSLSNFKYVDEKGKALNISQATVSFNPSHVDLKRFSATTGKTDLNVTGTLDNFYGFLFKKQELKGNFNLQSNQLAVADFMTSETPDPKKATPPSEAIKIPAFLNCTLTAKVNSILYDNLVLKNASGKMLIKDQKVSLQNIKIFIFDGQITANGDVSTKEKTPVFDMDLNMAGVDIQQTFTQLEMMKKVAPIAGVVSGKLNAIIKLDGPLDAKAMTPDLNKLNGDLTGQLLSTSINPENSTLLKSLGSSLKFLDLKKLNLKDVKINLTFNDGKVNVKPFDLKYQDIKATVGGQHGFDQNMNYNLKLDVPAKYLGTEANALLAKLSPSDVNKLQNIPINAVVTGNFKNPKVSTDMKQATTNLATQLLKQQKDKLVNQGTSALKDLLGGSKKDTTKTGAQKEDIKAKAGALLNGLFGKKK